MTGLVLKNEKGWFAAGVEVEKALHVLSDRGFELFIYLCLAALDPADGKCTNRHSESAPP